MTPADLPDRVEPIAALRAKALLRNSFGDLETAKGVLERLAELAGALDETTPDDIAKQAPRGGRTARTARNSRSAVTPPKRKG